MNETNPLLQRRRPRSLYEAISPEDFESEEGLAKIQTILDSIAAAEEHNLPSLAGHVPARRRQQQQQQQRMTSTTPTAAYIFWCALATVVVVTMIIISAARMMPTPGEQAVAQHYYGDTSSFTSSTSMRIRQAQDEADMAYSSSRDSRYLRHKHNYDKMTKRNETAVEEEDDPSADTTVVKDHDLYEGCETTVLILRHCEKSSVAEHCAYDGFERSFYLSTLFGVRWPQPYKIYAEHPADRRNSNKRNFREVETVGPTALKFDIPVDVSYSEVRPLGKAIWKHVHSGALCGRLVVVAWKHTDIALLGRSLGCGPMQGCPLDYHGKTFDDAWQIKFVYDHWPHSESKRHFANVSDGPSWKVFGSVQQERFDPLEVSYRFGGYRGPDGRSPSWRENVTDVPERKNRYDHNVKYDEANIELVQENP